MDVSQPKILETRKYFWGELTQESREDNLKRAELLELRYGGYKMLSQTFGYDDLRQQNNF